MHSLSIKICLRSHILSNITKRDVYKTGKEIVLYVSKTRNEKHLIHTQEKEQQCKLNADLAVLSVLCASPRQPGEMSETFKWVLSISLIRRSAAYQRRCEDEVLPNQKHR